MKYDRGEISQGSNIEGWAITDKGKADALTDLLLHLLSHPFIHSVIHFSNKGIRSNEGCFAVDILA